MKHAEFAELNPDLDPEESTIDNVMAKVNRITELLRGGTAALAIICSLCAYGAVTVEKAKLSSLPGKTMIVTEVNYTAEDLNTNAIIALVAEYDQTNITPRIDAKVESVNGMTGTVVLVAADVGAAVATNTYTKSQVDLEISGAVSPVNTIAVNANAVALTAEAKADAALSDLDGKLDKSGGTISGELFVSGNASLDGDSTTVENLTASYLDAFLGFKVHGVPFYFPDTSGTVVVQQDLDGFLRDDTAEYDEDSIYAAGAFVKYLGSIWVCKTAITTAEAWTPAHWTEMPNVAALFGSGNTALTSRVNTLIEARIGDIEQALKHILGGN